MFIVKIEMMGSFRMEVTGMLIKAINSVGLYCQNCGRMHIYDIPYFAGEQKHGLFCPHCGQRTAVISYETRTLLRLSLNCSICGHRHSSVYQKRLLPKMQITRIYCHRDNFELGYIGKRRSIEAVLAASQAAFEELHPGEGIDVINRQRQMLDTVNVIHDMASLGQLFCACGGSHVEVDIQGSRILLECRRCGRVAVVNTADSDVVDDLSEYRRLDFRRVKRRKAEHPEG